MAKTAQKSALQVIETKASTGRTVYAISHRLTKESMSNLHKVCQTLGIFLYACKVPQFGGIRAHFGAKKSFEGTLTADYIKALLKGSTFQTETPKVDKPKGKVEKVTETRDERVDALESKIDIILQALAGLKK